MQNLINLLHEGFQISSMRMGLYPFSKLNTKFGIGINESKYMYVSSNLKIW